jgi:hypothetical protein
VKQIQKYGKITAREMQKHQGYTKGKKGEIRVRRSDITAMGKPTPSKDNFSTSLRARSRSSEAGISSTQNQTFRTV